MAEPQVQVTNKFILALLNNINLMVGSDVLTINWACVISDSVIRRVSQFIPTFDQDLLECLWYNYNSDFCMRNYNFIMILISMMRKSHETSRDVLESFIKLLEWDSSDQLVQRLKDDVQNIQETNYSYLL
jgi:hypothetical protein